MDLASLLRTAVLLGAQGWRDHYDADALRHDPAFRLAVRSSAGMTPLGGPGLASQPTLSRFTAMMAAPANLKALREVVLELADRVRERNKGKRMPKATLDVDYGPLRPSSDAAVTHNPHSTEIHPRFFSLVRFVAAAAHADSSHTP